MCLSQTNTDQYYIYCSLPSLYGRLDISLNHSVLLKVSRTESPFALPKGAREGRLVLLLACRPHTFCVHHRDLPLYLVELCSHNRVHPHTGVLIRLCTETPKLARHTITPTVALHGIVVGVRVVCGGHHYHTGKRDLWPTSSSSL